MLVEFRVKNYRSFKDEQVLSMVAGKDDSLPGNTFEAGKLKLLKSAAIYGPNASGKSNLIRALFAMSTVVAESANIDSSLDWLISPYLFDKLSKEKPSEFEININLDGVRYQYGFTASPKRILDEWLIAYPKEYPQKWFIRKYNKKTKKTDWSFKSPYFKGEKNKLVGRTHDSALLLSVGAQWNNEQLLKIYNWLSTTLQFILPTSDLSFITASYMDDKNPEYGKIRHSILSLLKNADLGVLDVKAKKQDFDESSLPKDISADRRKKILENAKRDFDVDFLHANKEEERHIPLPLAQESDGTQRLFQLAGPWLLALQLGFTIIVDELESSMHPLLARKLVELFGDPKTNKSNAQLIFATHDTHLLDPELLRRDQIWFTEKGNDGATKLYPLSDYKPRKNEALQKGYLSGRYGAIPILDKFGVE